MQTVLIRTVPSYMKSNLYADSLLSNLAPQLGNLVTACRTELNSAPLLQNRQSRRLSKETSSSFSSSQLQIRPLQRTTNRTTSSSQLGHLYISLTSPCSVYCAWYMLYLTAVAVLWWSHVVVTSHSSDAWGTVLSWI